MQKTTRKATAALGEIKRQTGGSILGEEIYMAGNQSKSVAERHKKANGPWGKVGRKVFRSKTISRGVQILLWNATTRSAMIYGLRAEELPRQLLDRMGAYMYKNLRAMVNPKMETGGEVHGGNVLCGKLRQSAKV